jgi:iron-sulfur cluster assembly protein
MNLITITDSAKERVMDLLSKRDRPCKGIRISLKTKGCNGLSYKLEFAEDESPVDEKIVIDDLTFFIDPKAIMFILGTEMDYKETAIQSGFDFVNPNEKGRCGCGKSFHV